MRSAVFRKPFLDKPFNTGSFRSSAKSPSLAARNGKCRSCGVIPQVFLCAEGLATHKQIHTNCSVNATYQGKTYCFGSKKAEHVFMKDSAANLAKAEAYYQKIHG
jgi:YHS domain-containing protein